MLEVNDLSAILERGNEILFLMTIKVIDEDDIDGDGVQMMLMLDRDA